MKVIVANEVEARGIKDQLRQAVKSINRDNKMTSREKNAAKQVLYDLVQGFQSETINCDDWNEEEDYEQENL